jgi:hypothetical protein
VPHGARLPQKKNFKEKRHTTILRYHYNYGLYGKLWDIIKIIYEYGLYGKLWDIIKIISLSTAGEKMTQNSLKETKPEETRTKTRDTPAVFCFFTEEVFFRNRIGVH